MDKNYDNTKVKSKNKFKNKPEFDFDLKQKSEVKNNAQDILDQEQIIEVTPEMMKTFEERVQTLETQNLEFKTMAQRIQADFDNYRKRNLSLRAEALAEGSQEAIKEILSVLDTFELAIDKSNAENSDACADPFVLGVNQVYKLFKNSLEKLGVTEIPALGEIFDPNMHNAVMQAEVDGAKSGEIVEVMQKGYRIRDKILRYSMVKVAN